MIKFIIRPYNSEYRFFCSAINAICESLKIAKAKNFNEIEIAKNEVLTVVKIHCSEKNLDFDYIKQIFFFDIVFEG
jgi:hypothetical protein